MSSMTQSAVIEMFLRLSGDTFSDATLNLLASVESKLQFSQNTESFCTSKIWSLPKFCYGR